MMWLKITNDYGSWVNYLVDGINKSCLIICLKITLHHHFTPNSKLIPIGFKNEMLKKLHKNSRDNL